MLKRKSWSLKQAKKKFFFKIAKVKLRNSTAHSDDLDFFHTAVEPIFTIARCFALMPIKNVIGSDHSLPQFEYGAWGLLATGFFLTFGTTILVLIFTKEIEYGITPRNIVATFFFMCGLCACTLFARLASSWPELIRHWTQVEIVFLGLPYKPTKRTVKFKVRVLAGIIAVLYAIEHGLFFTSDVYNYRMKKLLCNDTVPASYNDFMKVHFFGYIFNHIPYHPLITVPLLILNGTFTFIWNYMDLFIVIVSIGLATRFEQIGQRALELSDRNVSQSTWGELRLHYVHLCELLEMTDEKMSWIILLSSTNNLYFICYQILNIFNRLRWAITYVYFWYSFLYLLGRTAFVFLCASKIHDESKVPLLAIRSVSSAGWGDEVERFSIQITGETVALSGRRLFFITRKLLFGMAATIVTYELVLLQLYDLTTSRGLESLCQ